MSTVPRIGVSTVSYLFKGLFQTPREGYFQIITGILALDQGLAFIGTSAREVPSLAFICTLLSNQESLVCSVAIYYYQATRKLQCELLPSAICI